MIDGMLGKLARWLRLIGNDAEYSTNLPDKELIRRASNGNMVLLTSDVNLYRMASSRGVVTYLVKGENEPERLARTVKRFNLQLEFNPSSSRCPKCGATITEVPKETVKNEVPPSTYETYERFWMCTNPNCGKVYWRGSHWKNIMEVLANTNKLIRNQTT
jgi:hypothetical protein